MIGDVIVPMVTPMKKVSLKEYLIDEDAAYKLISQLLVHGIKTLFLFGYAGGCDKGITITQREEHLDKMLKYVHGILSIVVGVSHQNLEEAIKLAEHADGTDAAAMVLLLNQAPDDYVTQVQAVLEATMRKPLILYNNPFIGQKKNLQPDEVEMLMNKYPGRIIGLKESSGDQDIFVSFIKLQQHFDARNIPFSLFMGDAKQIPWIISTQDLYRFKVPGVVPVEANIPERTGLYAKLLDGGNADGIEYLSIPQTIEKLISQNLVDPATLDFFLKSN